MGDERWNAFKYQEGCLRGIVDTEVEKSTHSSGLTEAVTKKEAADMYRCISSNPSDHEVIKEEECIQRSADSGPFAMGFGNPDNFDITGNNDKLASQEANLKQDPSCVPNSLPCSKEVRMQDTQQFCAGITENRPVKNSECVRRDICNHDKEKIEETYGGHISNIKIQQPHSPDVESSTVFTAQRVITQATRTQTEYTGNHEIEREYLLVPFSPGYCFSKLKEENILLTKRIKSLEERSERPRFALPSPSSQLQRKDVLDPRNSNSNNQLIIRILEKVFSKDDVEHAMDYLRLQNDQDSKSMTKLLQLLYDVEDGKVPTLTEASDKTHDTSTPEEWTAEDSEFSLHMTFKMKKTVNSGWI